jgi:outer membrane receptor protein involved in Fe transport
VTTHSNNLLFAATLVPVCLATYAAAAETAPGAPGDPMLDEIIVTAQKRTERLLDVPLSVTAVTGDQLLEQGIDAPTELDRVVAGFSYQQSSFGVPYSRSAGLVCTIPLSGCRRR